MDSSRMINLGSGGGTSTGFSTSVGAFVRLSTNYTITAADTWEKLPFDTEIWDFGGDFDAVTDNDFTVPADGYYRISMQCRTANYNVGDEPFALGFKIDGTFNAVAARMSPASIALEPTAQINKVVLLSANEVLDFWALHGATVDVLSAESKTWVQIEQLATT